MSKSFDISAIFKVVDKMTSPLKKIDAAITNTGKAADRAGATIDKSFNNINRAANRSSRSVDNLKRSFNFQNQIFKVKELARALQSLGQKVTPGLGSLAVGVGGAYVGKQILDNSSQYEQQEVTTAGLIQSSPDFKKKYSFEQQKDLAVRQAKLAEDAGNKSIGQFSDYMAMINKNLAVGLEPTERMMNAFGAMSAAMPAVDDKAGQFLQTMGSIFRGEMATADNIPGVKGRIDRKTHEARLEKDGKKYELGLPGSKGYEGRVTKAFQEIAETYFSKLGEMQGQTFEAKWSTMVSSMTRGLDGMLRHTDVWEKFVKVSVDGINQTVINLTPKFTELAQSLFSKLDGKMGNLGIEDKISKMLDKVIESINNLSDADVQAVVDNMMKIPGLMYDLSAAVVELLPNLTKLVGFLAHPIDTVIGNDVKDAGKYIDDAKKSKSYPERVIGNTLDAPAALFRGVASLFEKDQAATESLKTPTDTTSTNTTGILQQSQQGNGILQQSLAAQNQTNNLVAQLLPAISGAISSGLAGIQINQNINSTGATVNTSTAITSGANTGKAPTGTSARK